MPEQEHRSPSPPTSSAKRYTVFVDDNFHYEDADHRYRLGEFGDYESAVAACEKVVDQFLTASHKPGMGWKALYNSYMRFGEDPFIVPDDLERKFSAWEYARRRSKEICRFPSTQA